MLQEQQDLNGWRHIEIVQREDLNMPTPKGKNLGVNCGKKNFCKDESA